MSSRRGRASAWCLRYLCAAEREQPGVVAADGAGRPELAFGEPPAVLGPRPAIDVAAVERPLGPVVAAVPGDDRALGGGRVRAVEVDLDVAHVVTGLGVARQRRAQRLHQGVASDDPAVRMIADPAI